MIMAFMSFVADLNMVEFSSTSVIPSLTGGSPTVLTLVLFLTVLGTLFRILQMERKGQKERLQEKVGELEK